MGQQRKNKQLDDKCICCPRCGSVNGDLYIGRSDLYAYYNKIVYCKKCIEEIYNRYLELKQDEKVAIYYMCRKLDIPFKHSAYEGALKESSDRGWKLYQAYIQKINSLGASNNYGNCFDDSDNFNLDKDDDTMVYNGEVDEDSKIFWGYGLDPKSYLFLDTELENWKRTHKCDNQAELTLLKEICMKILEIRQKREQGKDVGKEQKDLQDLMKTASVDPAKSNAASAGKSIDTFGMWVKDIEQFRPAEWHEQQEKYKDMDGFVTYIKNYIMRPIKNFLTGDRDFVINEDMNFDLDVEIDEGE